MLMQMYSRLILDEFCITKKNKLQKIREKRFLSLDTTLPTPSSPYSPVLVLRLRNKERENWVESQ